MFLNPFEQFLLIVLLVKTDPKAVDNGKLSNAFTIFRGSTFEFNV